MKQAPHNATAENAVIGAVLVRGLDAFDAAAEVVTADDFWQPRARAIFAAATTIAGRGEPIDMVTLEAEIRARGELRLVEGVAGLADFANTHGATHNVAHHAEIVRRAAVLRRLADAAREVAEEAYSEPADVDEFVDASERKILAVGEDGRKTTLQPSRGLVRVAFEAFTARHKRKNPITGVPTLFEQLDGMLCGLQPGDLVILAARPSMGKTALALSIAAHACVARARHRQLPKEQRPVLNPCLFFSLEMSAQSLIERVLCAEARVDFTKTRKGQFLEDDFRRLIAAGDRVADAPLVVDDESAPTILEIRARARRWKENRDYFDGSPDQHGLVVVDYLQLCRGGGRFDSREQEIAEVSRGLKGLAKDLKVPVLALSQLNRQVDGRADHRPQLGDLRESGSIEQDADVVMFVYRPERYLSADATAEERAEVEGVAEIIIGKQRNGPIGTVPLTFLKRYVAFANPGKGATP